MNFDLWALHSQQSWWDSSSGIKMKALHQTFIADGLMAAEPGLTDWACMAKIFQPEITTTLFFKAYSVSINGGWMLLPLLQRGSFMVEADKAGEFSWWSIAWSSFTGVSLVWRQKEDPHKQNGRTNVMKEEKLQTETKNKEKEEEDGGWWEACQRRRFVVGQKPPRDYWVIHLSTSTGKSQSA